VELPEPGDDFEEMEPFGTIEAVKAESDLYCPVAGEVAAINEVLDEDPALVNTDPYGEGWMLTLRVADRNDVEALMDAVDYAIHIGE